MRLMGFAVVLALGLTLAVLAAEAQQSGRVYRVGVLSPGSPPPGPLDALRQGLRELGYEGGRNLSIDWRFSGATDDRLRDLADELVHLKVDVIVAINTQASLAAKRATAKGRFLCYRPLRDRRSAVCFCRCDRRLTTVGWLPRLRLRPPRPRRPACDLAARLGGQSLRPSFAVERASSAAYRASESRLAMRRE